ncbi:UDP-glucose 4-epimerase [Nocardioides daedukensis]|uniref:UDP-glucose 4-epimerase n=1 Tax=Nocardioides daedukensis TaxID=634462 RepID=A0A7Y9S1P6_9ACTN|nr:UDP-glucose 4-epimerase GalE [Nocardioides daedukensis]NYG60280.1 UDP-glucose 4-epimerase [Nocardioides daedukensis]
MNWLVTGGAGYIGSHVVRALQRAGLNPVVLDDLSTGFSSFVPAEVPFIETSLCDRERLDRAMRQYRIDGVVHLAGFKYAGVSVSRPVHTYEQNVSAMVTLLGSVRRCGIDKFVFSSSAAVYGSPTVDRVTESTPTAPESPYGESKLFGETLLRDVAAAEGIRHTSLRYFNVVGSGACDLYDASPHNLFPVVFDMLSSARTPRINGDDYPTPDGTCVRDYVHVADLAEAHVAAAVRTMEGQTLRPVYNLGSGTGSSVRQIMDAVRSCTGISFEPLIAPRRPGDPARIVADGHLAAADLGWTMRHDLESMVASAWEARCVLTSRKCSRPLTR